MPKVCLMCGDSFPDTTTFCPKDGSALRAAVHGDDLIGELIAERYLITDLLSQGGMGAVYLASDVRLPQKFAVKVLRQQQTSDPSLIQRFRQEAEAVCRINHDRVARVFDFGFMPDGRAYIVMEYVAGHTLKQLVEERGAIDPTEAAKITLMAAEGIDAAHRLGIVHRDLKPENIMTLDDPGGGMRVKVLDFGIAKLENADSSQGYTQPGFVIGTPAWMSPEQLTGAPLDARSDIYSLALVSFSLFTGERAFTGDSEQSEMLARISVPPRTLSESAPQVAWPQELQAAFDRALSREANQRPSTTVQFATMLVDAVNHWKEHSGERSVSHTPQSPATRTPTPTPKRVTPPVTPPAVAATPVTSSRRTVLMSVVGVAVLGAAALAFVLSKGGDNSTSAGADTTGTIVATVPPPVPASQASDSGTKTDTANATAANATAANAAAANAGRSTVVPPAPPSASPNRGSTGTGQSPQTNGVGTSPTVKPPVPTPVTVPGGSIKRDEELRSLMDAFDAGDGAALARETINKITAIQGRLAGVDKAWAPIYIGKAHMTLGDKAQACVAFKRGLSLAADSKAAREDAEQWILTIPCPP